MFLALDVINSACLSKISRSKDSLLEAIFKKWLMTEGGAVPSRNCFSARSTARFTSCFSLLSGLSAGFTALLVVFFSGVSFLLFVTNIILLLYEYFLLVFDSSVVVSLCDR